MIDVCYVLNTAMFLLALALVKPLGQSVEHWIFNSKVLGLNFDVVIFHLLLSSYHSNCLYHNLRMYMTQLR